MLLSLISAHCRNEHPAEYQDGRDQNEPKKNLFDIMGNSALEEKMFQRVIRKRNRIKGGLHHLTYIVKARCKMKKLDISLGDARKEAWRLMLITSQSRNPPKPNKSTRTAIIQGMKNTI